MHLFQRKLFEVKIVKWIDWINFYNQTKQSMISSNLIESVFIKDFIIILKQVYFFRGESLTTQLNRITPSELFTLSIWNADLSKDCFKPFSVSFHKTRTIRYLLVLESQENTFNLSLIIIMFFIYRFATLDTICLIWNQLEASTRATQKIQFFSLKNSHVRLTYESFLNRQTFEKYSVFFQFGRSSSRKRGWLHFRDQNHQFLWLTYQRCVMFKYCDQKESSNNISKFILKLSSLFKRNYNYFFCFNFNIIVKSISK